MKHIRIVLGMLLLTYSHFIKIKENKSDSIDVRNSILLKKEYTFPYNNNFNIKYDPFKEKMKDSWVGDILKQIFFR